jgi:hypothetical protein
VSGLKQNLSFQVGSLKMKKIIVALMLVAASFGTMTSPSAACAKDRISLDEARDLLQLGKQTVGAVKKVRNGIQTASDAIGNVQNRISSVRNIGKALRRR